MKNFIIPTIFIALITSGHNYANVIVNSNCSTSTVQITGITPTSVVGANLVAAGSSIDSTSCLGYVTSPNNDFANSPDPNIGALGDGLLNEEIFKGYFVPGDTFLTNDDDSMVDLDGDGDATDPGWIRLGGAEAAGGNLDFVYDSMNGYDLAQVIDVSVSFDGTWSLTVDPAAILFATTALGRPTVFDHLAFVMKGPTVKEENEDLFGEWAIYDFNFHDLIDDGYDIKLGDTTYAFTGTWDVDLFDGKDLSHLSIWAHDPPADIRVPEPSTLAIFALVLMGLLLRESLKNTKRKYFQDFVC